MSNNLSLATSQRVDFTSLFTKDGYEVESIIGTTYCLNFETLLMLILAITYGPGADKALEHKSDEISPAAIFTAIKHLRGKLKVYCQADKIDMALNGASNETVQRIKTLLDDFVVPVPMQKVNGAFSSFHSKLWLITFKKVYRSSRMIVTSRNLTSNRDFDAVAVFDNAGRDKSCVTEILNQLPELPKELKNISFETQSVKIKVEDIKNCHSVISPFLDPGLLKNTEIPQLHIFSLRSEIDKVCHAIPELVEKYKFYCLNPALETSEEEGNHSSIHAKLYISDQSIILGSSNFTCRGWHHNREFNVKLEPGIDEKTLLKEFGVDETEKNYGCGMFIPYSPSGKVTEEKDEKEDILQELACITLLADWDETSEMFSLELSCPDGIHLPENIAWRPLGHNEWKTNDLSWKMPVQDVSKVFICKIDGREVQMLSSWKDGVPQGLWDQRYEAEIAKLSIADELDFRMLSLEADKLYGRDVPLKRNGEGNNSSHCPPRPPIFERLLKADKAQLEKFFEDPISARDNDPLGLVQAFEELKKFFIPGGTEK